MAGMVGPSRSVQTKCLKPKVTVSANFLGYKEVRKPQKYCGQGGIEVSPSLYLFRQIHITVSRKSIFTSVLAIKTNGSKVVVNTAQPIQGWWGTKWYSFWDVIESTKPNIFAGVRELC